MYASEHVISAELKTYFRDVIRENRRKHDRHSNPKNLPVIERITNMWWNPSQGKRVTEALRALRSVAQRTESPKLLPPMEAPSAPVERPKGRDLAAPEAPAVAESSTTTEGMAEGEKPPATSVDAPAAEALAANEKAPAAKAPAAEASAAEAPATTEEAPAAEAPAVEAPAAEASAAEDPATTEEAPVAEAPAATAEAPAADAFAAAEGAPVAEANAAVEGAPPADAPKAEERAHSGGGVCRPPLSPDMASPVAHWCAGRAIAADERVTSQKFEAPIVAIDLHLHVYPARAIAASSPSNAAWTRNGASPST